MSERRHAQPKKIGKPSQEEIRIAEALSVRAAEILKSSDLDRALPIARHLLRLAPIFGGNALKDEEIASILETEGIGVETFKKALTLARRSITKKPESTARKRRADGRTAVVQQPDSSLVRSNQPSAKSMVQNTDRKLL